MVPLERTSSTASPVAHDLASRRPRGPKGSHREGAGCESPAPRAQRPARPRPCYLMGLPLPPPPEAEAAWLTCWSHVVVFVGFISIVEPTSSNSKSSASEPYWRTSVRFWALPVLAVVAVAIVAALVREGGESGRYQYRQ